MTVDMEKTEVLPTLNVLLIDDHVGERLLVRDALASSSPQIKVHEVENAVQAFWFLAKQREFRDHPTPDLILLDLAMPVIDGQRVLEVLRRDPQWSQLPVVVLTASARDVDLSMCHDLGAVAFITKPALWQDYLILGEMLMNYLTKRVAPTATGNVQAHFFVRGDKKK